MAIHSTACAEWRQTDRRAVTKPSCQQVRKSSQVASGQFRKSIASRPFLAKEAHVQIL